MRRRRLVIGWKQRDFHSMPNSMKVTHHFTTGLVFCFFFNFFLPSSISPFSCPLLCGLLQPIFRLQLLCTELGHGKGLFVAAGTCATFSNIFSPFSFNPVRSGETVGKLWTGGKLGGNLCVSPRAPVWFQYFYIVKVSNFAKRSWWTPLFLSFFLFLLVSNAFNNL